MEEGRNYIRLMKRTVIVAVITAAIMAMRNYFFYNNAKDIPILHCRISHGFEIFTQNDDLRRRRNHNEVFWNNPCNCFNNCNHADEMYSCMII